MVPASSPASLNSDIGRPPPATSFAQTHDVVHSDLFVRYIRSFLGNLSLLINHKDETWRKHEQYQGAVNDVGRGDLKARKRGRHEGKLCQTRSPTMYVSTVFHPLSLLPDDPLHLIVNISLYLSCRFDSHNASGNGDIPLQGYYGTPARLCSATQGTVSYPPLGPMLLAIHWPVL